MIVGLTGRIGAGKDTAAKGLLSAGFERASFADVLRDFTYAQDPIVYTDTGMSMRLVPLVDALGWEAAKRGHRDVRRLLQRTGTEAGRQVLGEDVWVNAAMARASSGDIVFTDVRFPNEADAIKAKGGYVIRVIDPHAPTPGPDAHASERAMAEYAVDEELVNDKQTMTAEDVAGALYDIVLDLSYANLDEEVSA